MAANTTRLETLRRQMFGSDTRPIILYLGSYGTAYQQAIALFASTVATLGNQYAIAFSAHPGYRSTIHSLERPIFEQNGLTNVVYAPSGVGSSELAALSAVTLSMGSTTGIQSLYIGVPAIYYFTPSHPYRDIGTEARLIPALSTSTAFNTTLDALKTQARPYRFDTKRLSALGIPADSLSETFNVLTRCMKSTSCAL